MVFYVLGPGRGYIVDYIGAWEGLYSGLYRAVRVGQILAT